MEDIRLFSYKMTNDNGFAPNPFYGMLTLANCKPCIRKHKKIGDWIAGFSSAILNGDKVGKERLVYLMKIEKIIPYRDYWNDKQYELKKPNLSSIETIDKTGDNIYKPINTNAELYTDFEQIPNKNHTTERNKIHDLSGKNVLISKCFYYFGSIPIEIHSEIKPCIPPGQSAHGARTHNKEKAEMFIQYIQNNYSSGIINMPHNWPTDETDINQKSCGKCK